MGEESKTTESLSPKEQRQRKGAKDLLDRSEREIRRLTELGVDVAALADRFDSAKAHFGDGRWSEAEMTCSEILILAKSMQAITSASMKAGAASGSKKISESMKMEISRLIAKEVGDRVEAVARTLPTASSLEETVQNKIQEALVTGGLVERLENIAAQKAKGAVANIPRFTAKDAQAAANLVVQRSLTQFLSSKDLAKKIKAAVETEITKAIEKAQKAMTKALEAHLNTKVASLVDPLPTKKDVSEEIAGTLKRFVKGEPFENRVLELAGERAKAEVERAPELMSEAASKIAREAADSLFKTHVRSKEFAQQVKEVAQSVANEIAEAMPSLSTEDVEVIARRVGEESIASLAESDVLREKMDVLGKQLVAEALSAGGFDDKVKALAREVAEATPHVTPEEFQKTLEEKLGGTVQQLADQLDERTKELEEKLGGGLAETANALDERTKALEEKLSEGLDEKVASALARLDEMSSGVVTKEELDGKLADKIVEARRELMTNEDFGEWLKDGALEVLREVGLGEGMAELEQKFVTAEQAEEKFLAAEQAEGGLVTPEEAEKISRQEALTAAMDMLETAEFTRRIVELMGDEEVREQIAGLGGGEDLELQARTVFAEQIESTEFADKVKEVTGGGDGDEVRKELVARVDRIEKEALPELIENAISEKVGAATPEGIDAKIQEALAARLDADSLNKQILEIATQSIGKIANTPEFKAMLDGKFKIVMNYLSQEVIPKQIRRQMGGG